MSKRIGSIFVTLGERLVPFGQDARSLRVIEAACRTNPWFMPDEIRYAVEAIRTQFLIPVECSAKEKKSDKRVGIIMAGNIPLVGFHDLLCVLMAGHRCVVKPSSKDSVLMEYVVELLREIAPEIPIEIVSELPDTVDAVIATGGEAANRYFRSRFSHIPTLLRGSRYSAAVLQGEFPAELADDLFLYSGLGCRSVSTVFVPRGGVDALATMLRAEASRRTFNPLYLTDYRQRKAFRQVCGLPYVDLGVALLVSDSAALSEIAVIEYKAMTEVSAWLAAHRDEIQCVVGSGYIPFGQSQRPGLSDYADGVDTREWLAQL